MAIVSIFLVDSEHFVADIRSGKAYEHESNGQDDEPQRSKFSRDAQAQLLKYVELSVHTRYTSP